MSGFAPEYLVTTEWLAAHLDDPNVIVLDCAMHLGHNACERLSAFLGWRSARLGRQRPAVRWARAHAGRERAVPVRAGNNCERLHGAMGPDECQTAMAAGAAWSEQEAVAAAEAA